MILKIKMKITSKIRLQTHRIHIIQDREETEDKTQIKKNQNMKISKNKFKLQR